MTARGRNHVRKLCADLVKSQQEGQGFQRPPLTGLRPGAGNLPRPPKKGRTDVQRYRLALHTSPDGAVMGWRPTPEQRAALVRAHHLASQMRDGGTGWTAIAERLTGDGYPTMHGGPWTYQMVQRLLRKPPPADPATAHSTRHWRLAEYRGPAKLLKCVDCAARGIDKYAYDWSHRHGTDPEEVMNYDPRCRKCHIDYDGSGHHTPHTEEARAKMSAAVQRGYADGTRIGRHYPRRRPAEG